MALTTEEVTVCNQALDRFGATNFTYANQATNANGERCNRLYGQTRKAVLRSFEWNFASARKTLVAETATPDFEWDYKYKLPIDFLRLKKKGGLYSDYTRVIEGDYLLTNDSSAEIKYIINVTDPDDFDPLFTEVLILSLAKKLIPLVAGTKSNPLVEDILRDLQMATARARAVNRSENQDVEDTSWNSARYGSGIV